LTRRIPVFLFAAACLLTAGSGSALSATLHALAPPSKAPTGTVPVSTQQPNPAGKAQDGQKVTVDNGKWSGLTPMTFTYQWQSCTAAGACTDIAGATANGYTVVASEVGSMLCATVTASNSAGKASAVSNMTSAVTAAAAGKGVSSRAIGQFTAKLTGKTLRWTLTFSHLTGRPTVAGLHKGLRGTNGTVFKTLCRLCSSPTHGTLTLTASQVDAMVRGRAYVNIHTSRNRLGEIRGQVGRAL
jgi:hypothetical protein